jgi:sugar lactone lactonase YvrE
MAPKLHNKRSLSRLLVLLCLFAPTAATRPGASARPLAAPGDELRIVDAAGETTPVVNERGRTTLGVVDGAGAPVTVRRWTSDTPEVARVTRKGRLVGRTYGFATITAETDLGPASTTTVVVRVSDRPGNRGRGQTQTDVSGNIYLSNPDESVIYRVTGLRDLVLAGSVGQAGFADGRGEDARFDVPLGLGIDNRSDGALFVADSRNHCVRRVGFNGVARVELGAPEVQGRMTADLTPADQALFDTPEGVAAAGRNLFVADTRNHAIFFFDAADQEVRLIAGVPGESGLAEGYGRDARFDEPGGMAISTSGALVAVADRGNDRVRLLVREAVGGGVRWRTTTLGRTASARNAASVDRGDAPGIAFDAPSAVAFDVVDNVYAVDRVGVSVITRPTGQLPTKVRLAGPGSFVRPVSLTVDGTVVLVLDAEAPTPERAVRAVEVGPPEIESVVPSAGGLIGGEEVVVAGRNFAPESVVTIGDAEVTDFFVESARRIRLRVPPQRFAGQRTLSVRTRGGLAQAAFTVLAPSAETIGTGQLTALLGGVVPYVGDGQRATDPSVSLAATDVAVESSGNLVVADSLHNRVRRIDMKTGVITTLAGTGIANDNGDGGPAVSAGITRPHRTFPSSQGDIVVTGRYYPRLISAATGAISSPCECVNVLAFVSDRYLYMNAFAPTLDRLDLKTGEIVHVAGAGGDPPLGDGGPAVDAGFSGFTGVVVSPDGAVFISDREAGRIRRVDPSTGIITTVVGGGALPIADGVRADQVALTGLSDFLLRPDGGMIMVLDKQAVNQEPVPAKIVAVDPTTGLISTLYTAPREGSDPPVGTAPRNGLTSVALDLSGNLYFTDGFVWRLDPRGRLSRVAGGRYFGINSTISPDGARVIVDAWARDADGGVLFVSGFDPYVRRFDPVSRAITFFAGNGRSRRYRSSDDGRDARDVPIGELSAIKTDARGGVFLADSSNARVLRVDVATGRIRTIAGTGRVGYTGDGGPAVAARLGLIAGLAIGSDGALYVSDIQYHVVRRIGGDGRITTVAGTGEAGFSGDGGPATAAALSQPEALVVDNRGNLYIVDTGNYRVRRVSRDGTIATVAGDGGSVEFVTGRPATETSFFGLSGFAGDPDGNLFVGTDGGRFVIRVDAATGRADRIAGAGLIESPGLIGYQLPAEARTTPLGIGQMEIDERGDLVFADNLHLGILVLRDPNAAVRY